MNLPDITIMGWAASDDQVRAGSAVLLGMVLAVGLLAAARRFSRVLIVLLVTVALAVGSWSAARFGLMNAVVSQLSR